mgnify:FL=1
MAKKPIRVNKKEKPVGTVAPEVYESNDSNKNEQQDLFSQSDPQSSTESPEEQKSNFSFRSLEEVRKKLLVKKPI